MSRKSEAFAYCIRNFFHYKMQSRIRFILAALLMMIVYLVYLVVYYKYQDYQVNSYISNLEKENIRLFNHIETRKDTFSAVQTPAYIDRIMKASQNRKNPGEEAIFLVDQKEVLNYKTLDTTQIITERKLPSQTMGMSNQEKWIYLVFGIRPE